MGLNCQSPLIFRYFFQQMCSTIMHNLQLFECWEWLKVGGEGDDRGWDGWMASPTQWIWVWVSSGNWWWTGKLGMLQSVGSQRWTRLSDWTELNWTELNCGYLGWCKIMHRIFDWVGCWHPEQPHYQGPTRFTVGIWNIKGTESSKMVLITYLQSRNRDTDVENRSVDMEAGKGEGGVNWESNIDVCTRPSIK